MRVSRVAVVGDGGLVTVVLRRPRPREGDRVPVRPDAPARCCAARPARAARSARRSCGPGPPDARGPDLLPRLREHRRRDPAGERISVTYDGITAPARAGAVMSAALRVVRRLTVASRRSPVFSSPASSPAAPAAARRTRTSTGATRPTGEPRPARRAQLRLGLQRARRARRHPVELLDAHGRQVPVTGMRLGDRGAPAADTEEPVEVVADLPDLPAGPTAVVETLSSDDLHRTSGGRLRRRHAVVAGGLDETGATPVEAALRWLVLVGLSGALGGSLALHLLWRSAAGRTGAPGVAPAVALAGRCTLAGAVTAGVGAPVLLVTRCPSARAACRCWSGYGCAGTAPSSACWCCWCGARPAEVPTVPGRVGPARGRGGPRLRRRRAAGARRSRAVPDPTRVLASAADLGAGRPRPGTWSSSPWRSHHRFRRDGDDQESARPVLHGSALPRRSASPSSSSPYISAARWSARSTPRSARLRPDLLLKVASRAVAGTLAWRTPCGCVGAPALHAAPRVLAERPLPSALLALACVLTAASRRSTAATSRRHPGHDRLFDRKVADLQETIFDPRPARADVVLVDVFDTCRPAPSPVQGWLCR